MAHDWLAQGVGFVSLTLGILTFYQTDDRKLKALMLALNLCHLLHFWLLGAAMSTMMALLSAGRTATAMYTSSKWVALIFVVLACLLGQTTLNQWLDLLPLVGGVLGTLGIFLLRGVKMRLLFIVAASCWLMNNVIIGSIGGIILEVLVISMNLLTIWRITSLQKQAVELKVG